VCLRLARVRVVIARWFKDLFIVFYDLVFLILMLRIMNRSMGFSPPSDFCLFSLLDHLIFD
jgi:hypothetical protein